MSIEPAPRTARVRATSERASAIVGRIVELALVVARGVALLAVVTAAAAVLAWVVWVTREPPSGTNDWAARIVVLAIGLVAPAVLGLFVLGLREVADLPRRVRELPPDLRTHLEDVRARSAGDGGRIGMARAVVRLARLLLEARDVLSPYAVFSAVFRPALLLAAIAAAFVALVEIPVALIAALVLGVR
jgi:hypothetical protein